jgi:hypothetical protein
LKIVSAHTQTSRGFNVAAKVVSPASRQIVVSFLVWMKAQPGRSKEQT